MNVIEFDHRKPSADDPRKLEYAGQRTAAEVFEELKHRLESQGYLPDEYFLLADFASYCEAEKRMVKTYADPVQWNRMSLHNIARSGIFAADRSIAQYADNIWHVPHK